MIAISLRSSQYIAIKYHLKRSIIFLQNATFEDSNSGFASLIHHCDQNYHQSLLFFLTFLFLSCRDAIVLQQLLKDVDIVEKLDSFDVFSIFEGKIDFVHVLAIYMSEANSFKSLDLCSFRQTSVDSVQATSSLDQVLKHHCSESII